MKEKKQSGELTVSTEKMREVAGLPGSHPLLQAYFQFSLLFQGLPGVQVGEVVRGRERDGSQRCGMRGCARRKGGGDMQQMVKSLPKERKKKHQTGKKIDTAQKISRK